MTRGVSQMEKVSFGSPFLMKAHVEIMAMRLSQSDFDFERTRKMFLSLPMR